MKYKRVSANGFTLIELLVVVGIIAILTAIIFPVIAKAREKAREATCASNERQLAMAIIEYAQDCDDTYPWSFSADSDEGAVTWPTLVNPYVKGYTSGDGDGANGGIIFCPDSPPTNYQSYSTNSQVIGLYGTPDDGENFYQSVVPMNSVADPTTTVLLGDALCGNADDPIDEISAMEYSYPHPALIQDHTNDPTWGIDWAVPNTDGNNDKQISWRHSGGANFAYCDGHLKWSRIGQLTDANFDVRCTPGVGCTGHAAPPNPADYPAKNPSCGNESAINCE